MLQDRAPMRGANVTPLQTFAIWSDPAHGAFTNAGHKKVAFPPTPASHLAGLAVRTVSGWGKGCSGKHKGHHALRRSELRGSLFSLSLPVCTKQPGIPSITIVYGKLESLTLFWFGKASHKANTC